jgi:hypothetical protein
MMIILRLEHRQTKYEEAKFRKMLTGLDFLAIHELTSRSNFSQISILAGYCHNI